MMKTMITSLAIVSGFALAGFVSVQGAANNTAKPAAASKETGKLYRHVVLFKFKESATEKEVQHIVDEFRALKSKIDLIQDYEHGTDVSPEGLAKGFTHCFLVTFKSKKDLEAYLPHEAHQAFVKQLKPILEDVLVVDYWTK